MSSLFSSLIHPFAEGLLPFPATGGGFLLRAEAPLDPAWRSLLVCEQSFRPEFLRLQAQGFTVTQRLDQGGFEVGLCGLTKHKVESQANMARAWAALAPGGVLVCAGSKDTGAASLAKSFGKAVGAVDGLSKHHAKIFWARKPDEAMPSQLADWLEEGRMQRVVAIDAMSQPGVYGWNKVDPGSALLAEQFGPRITGRVADLGAGWGYLSRQLVARCPGITALDAVEAEGLAVEAARANLGGQARVLWTDAASELADASYDWIVSNPPFHAGKAADVDLGRAFIAAAGRALVPGGRLMLVANRHLPYEQVVDAKIGRHAIIAETNAFKVIEAQKTKGGQ